MFFGQRYKRKTKKQRKCREFIPYQSVATLLAPRPFAVPVLFGVNEPLVETEMMKKSFPGETSAGRFKHIFLFFRNYLLGKDEWCSTG